MKLTSQEVAMGCIVVTCSCCGNVYKTHKLANSLVYSLRPGFGCYKCQGVAPEADAATMQEGLDTDK